MDANAGEQQRSGPELDAEEGGKRRKRVNAAENEVKMRDSPGDKR